MRVHTISKRSLLAGVAVSIVAFGVACSINSPDNIVGPKPSSPKPTRMTADQVYFEFQVEKPVAPKPGNASPRYPTALRDANVEGEVLAQFVVDESGIPDMATFKTLKSTDAEFTTTVKTALARAVFFPALVGGHPVKQLVQMPFQFNLTKSNKVASARGVTITAASPPGSRAAVLTEVPVTSRAPTTTTAAPARGAPRPLSAGLTEVPVSSGAQTPAGEPNAKQTYFEFQISQPATPRADNPSPRYPDALRRANVEGEVLAQFVVNADGRVDVGTLKVLKTTDPLFSQAVRDALPQLSFNPAMADGRAVRQLMQMPFTFSLSKQP